jgi:hypothetical protein
MRSFKQLQRSTAVSRFKAGMMMNYRDMLCIRAKAITNKNFADGMRRESEGK